METIFQAIVQMASDPVGTVDVLKRLGVSRIKVFVPWSSVAPAADSRQRPRFDATDPAAYPAHAWDQYDAMVKAAHARGIGILMAVGAPPLWAAGPGAPPGGPWKQWKPSAPEFGAFVEAIGKRYSGSYTPPGATAPLPRVNTWSVWNEPNYGIDLAPQAVNQVEVAPLLYRRLLDAAWTALHATGHGSDTILIGELAPRGQRSGGHPGNFDGMVPLRFLRALYCVDGNDQPLQGAPAAARGCPTTSAASAAFRTAHPALFEASGVADHPYPEGALPPNQVIPGEPDYADLASLPRLEQTLDRLQQVYGSHRRFPIWNTEFGYQTNPPETILGKTSPSVAAYYLNWSEYLFWRDPRVASYDQYLLTDPPAPACASGACFATGIEFSDGRQKPMYPAFRLPLYLPVTSFAHDQAVEVWGAVRPARHERRPQSAVLEFQPAGGGAFRTIRTLSITDPDGYFDVRQTFPASGTVRLAYTYPQGPRAVSRSVSISVR